MGGLMSITGLPGQGPVRVGIPVADLTAGLFCALGILVALLEREESGEGQWVQTSLLQAQISMLDFQAARWLIKQRGARSRPATIIRPAFRPACSRPPTATSTSPATGQAIWERLVQRARRAGARSSMPDYETPRARSKNRDALNAEIDEHTAKTHQRRMGRALNEAGVPCGPIYSIDQVFADPQVEHLGMAQPVSTKAGNDAAHGRPAGDAVAHAEQARGAAARAWAAHRRDAARSSASAQHEIALRCATPAD